VTIHQMKKLAARGWKINSTGFKSKLGRRGAPGRRHRLVRP
jgi:hypothetical protein